MEAWLLTALSFTVLWIFWRFLNWTLDLIECAQRAQSRSRDTGMTHTKGKVL